MKRKKKLKLKPAENWVNTRRHNDRWKAFVEATERQKNVRDKKPKQRR